MEIDEQIRRIVHEVTGKMIHDREQHLLSDEAGIVPMDFLYVFSKLEMIYGKGIYVILKKNDYSVMTIRGLAKAIQRVETGEDGYNAASGADPNQKEP